MKEFKKCSILKEENSTHSDKTINEQVENYYSQRPDLARKEIADLENTIVELKNANRELAEYNAELQEKNINLQISVDLFSEIKINRKD